MKTFPATVQEATGGGAMHTPALEQLTTHATCRGQQRAISRLGLDLALYQGMEIEQNGATVFFLGRRHLPADLAPAETGSGTEKANESHYGKPRPPVKSREDRAACRPRRQLPRPAVRSNF